MSLYPITHIKIGTKFDPILQPIYIKNNAANKSFDVILGFSK